MQLRQWQQEAMEKYRLANPRDYLVTATPGAGKTTFALTIVSKLLEVNAINQVIIIVPTDHLRKQWGDSAIEKGIFLDPSLPNNDRLVGEDFQGYVATYAQVANNPGTHRSRAMQDGKRTLVVFDEIHHAGDGLSWGEAVRLAFEKVDRRLCLTGTPFRTSESSTIPFVRYRHNQDGTKESVADYTYGYKEALGDGIVRPVTFAAYSGSTKWTNSAGDTLSAKLMGEDLTKEEERAAWKTALSPQGSWIPHVIAAADERLTQLRNGGMSNAGAMVLASDQDSAREYAKIVKKITKTTPTVVLSDDNSASRKISAFSDSKDPKDRWLIAVRMVSEGVDVPRLAVGIWATNYRTPLFFAQAVGRFVRLKATGEVATVFLPAVRPLLALAAGLEESRKHIIPPPKDADDLGDPELLDDAALEEANKEENERGGGIIAVQSEAEFAHVLYNGRAITDGISEEDADYLGLPGLLSPEQIAAILRKRDLELRKLVGQDSFAENEKKEENPMRAIEIRKDINRIISRVALKRNISHGYLHKKLRSEVPGEPTAHASLELLEKRYDWLLENYS